MPEVPEPGGPAPPPPSPGPAPPPASAAFCFEWGGQKWGRDYPGWGTFKAWLTAHGADPDTWVTQHPAAASCIGASKSAYCFEWGGEKWGKDHPGWSAFRAWLIDHGADPEAWIIEHAQAAKCIGAPKPTGIPVTPPVPPPPGPQPKPKPKPTPPPPPAPPPAPPPPPEPAASPFGDPTAAGPFQGTGIMVGNNPDVISTLLEPGYRTDHGLTWVALPPGIPSDQVDALRAAGYEIVAWQPPESASRTDPQTLVDQYGAVGYIGQAESQDQWNQAVSDVGKVSVPTAIITDNWQPGGYGTFPPGTVAMPETYVNAGSGADYNGLPRFMDEGAAAVVPLAGIWSDDNNAPAIYDSLQGRGLPGVAGYTGEDLPAPGGLDAITTVGRNLGAATTPPAEPGPSAPPPAAPPPNVDPQGRAYCFEWGGEKWGGDYPGWAEFKAWLLDHGGSPAQWTIDHPTAALCIGAPGAQAAQPAPPTEGGLGGATLGGATQFTHAQLEQLWIIAGGPADKADVAAAIAQAESGGCRFAKAGPEDDRPVKACVYRHTTAENSYGLWQINLQAHPVYSPSAMYQAGHNAEAAVAVSNHGTDFRPWSTYNNHAYERYLTHGAVPPPPSQPPGPGQPPFVPPGPIPVEPQPGGIIPGSGPSKAPSGINNAWRYVLRRFSRLVPQQAANAKSIFANPKELFR